MTMELRQEKMSCNAGGAGTVQVQRQCSSCCSRAPTTLEVL